MNRRGFLVAILGLTGAASLPVAPAVAPAFVGEWFCLLPMPFFSSLVRFYRPYAGAPLEFESWPGTLEDANGRRV